MKIIAPSILSCDFSNLGTEIARTHQTKAEYIHIDVMDGCFVPNLTIGPCVISSLRKYSTKVFDVHLMIEEPIRYISAYRNAGADVLTVHAEACSDLKATLLAIRESGAKVGLSIKPKTDPKTILPFLSLCDMLLVMTVEPGFGGQKFMADMMPKVQAIRGYIDAMNPACELEVDGGVDGDTCKLCIASGANVLVAGSAVYKAADIPAKIKELRG